MELNWHKSSYSGQHGGNCVEVAETSQAVHMRDTQHRHLDTLSFSPEAFTTLLADLKAADYADSGNPGSAGRS